MTFLRLPVNPTNVPDWVRKAATTLNAMAAYLEKPQIGATRYTTRLEYWDGAAWQPVP